MMLLLLQRPPLLFLLLGLVWWCAVVTDVALGQGGAGAGGGGNPRPRGNGNGNGNGNNRHSNSILSSDPPGHQSKAAKQRREKIPSKTANANNSNNTDAVDKPWLEADRREKLSRVPRSAYHPHHWVFLHYHKTGHDLIHHFSEPFRACNAAINFKYKRRVDGADFVSSILKNDDISLLTAPDMLFDWGAHFNLPQASAAAANAANAAANAADAMRLVHFVRDPFDMIISAYLYHAQLPPPPPERWLLLETFDPCVVDMSKTRDQYGVKLQQFWKANQQQHGDSGDSNSADAPDVLQLIDQTVDLCKQLTAKFKYGGGEGSSSSGSNSDSDSNGGGGYSGLLQRAKKPPAAVDAAAAGDNSNSNTDDELDDALLDGLRIEATRSILSSTGGDMLRMGANALFDAQTSNGRSRRVFLSEFPVGDAEAFRASSASLYQFLMSMGTTNHHHAAAKEQMHQHRVSVPFWGCMSLEEAVNRTMAAGYIDHAPTAQGVEGALNERQHVTAGFLTSKQKEHYRQLLAADPVVGPLLTLLQQALKHEEVV